MPELKINPQQSPINPFISVLLYSMRICLILFALATMTGCGSTLSSHSEGTASIQEENNFKIYHLSQDELKLDCRKLTGRTQVRIMASRGADFKDSPSSASKALGFVTGTIFGTNAGKNSNNQSSNDRLILEAYNKRLKELGCKSFDLEKELANRPSAPTPEPTIEAKNAEIITQNKN